MIGFTNEQDSTLISFNYEPNYEMRFYTGNIPSGIFVAVNETVTLDTIVYPGVFSIAVEIVQREYRACSSTS